jgi:hypothetical protein
VFDFVLALVTANFGGSKSRPPGHKCKNSINSPASALIAATSRLSAIERGGADLRPA